MKVRETYLKGCFVIELQVFEDNRGTFSESFNQKIFGEKIGEDINFVQDNQSVSKKGVVRGLHLQKGEYAQSKLVRVIRGKILDVVVDFRQNSETFGQSFTCILSGENNKQIFVPRGFFHGFSVLEEDSICFYKCDNFYHKQSELGIVYNDPSLNINWMLKEDEIILSEKDKQLKTFKELLE